ncbi:SIMPL domain-containing protein [Peribacillus sp. B-H-3]|jgi:uncharacterized protein|uniref:SIMPL domain-containing protein n=1 Tax=Peribacillus sp. B-H-3 TaxID=3400420 RepID=UPI003B018116
MPQKEHKLISVSGEGSVPAVPDQAAITLGAVTESKDPASAQKENNKSITDILSALAAKGMKKENMKTIEYRVDPLYDYAEGKAVSAGYRVTHMIRIITDDIEQAGELVDTAVQHGANAVASVSFTLKNPEMYYNKAFILALLQTRSKAEAAAKTLRVSLNEKPVYVQELSQSPQPFSYQSAVFAKSPGAPIQQGELLISASAKADYTYQ